MDKLKILKRSHKGHLGRAISSLEDALEHEDGVDPTNVTKYLESVSLKFQKVEEDSNKLLEIYTKEEDIETEITELDSLQEKVTNVKIRAQEALETIKEMKEDEKRKKVDSEKTPLGGRREDRPRKPKLPDLLQEKFNGDLEHYQEFIDSFTSIIDNDNTISPVDKFRYLRMYLEDAKEGDGPKSLIEGFSTTADNYQVALQLIKETYGKKERIIMTHVSKLLNLEVKENLDKNALRILYNKVQTHVRSLEVLGISSDQYSIFLVPIVLSKLTHYIRVEWGKVKQNEDIDELLVFMNKQVQSLEEARQVEMAFSRDKETAASKKRYNNISSDSRNSPRPSSAAALHTITRKICLFCPESSNHWVEHCSKAKALPLSERKEILLKENACWCCFRKGHRKYECRQLNKLVCEICKRRHHTLLHEEVLRTNATCAACSSEVLRPIARGRLMGPSGKQLEVNILLDPCSDKSFVDKETSDALGLKNNHQIEISIEGIAGLKDDEINRNVVEATIKNRHHLEKYQKVQLIELPVICNTLTRPEVKKEVLSAKYIRNLQLADDYSVQKKCKINVLLGLDSYYSVVSGKVRRSPEKPIAVDSIFGWVLVSDSSNTCSAASNIVCMLITAKEENQISQQLKKFWEIEEVNPVNKSKWNPTDTKTFNHFKTSIDYRDQKYTVRLPMIKELREEEIAESENTYNNKALAYTRLMKNQKRCKRDPVFEERHNQAVKEYIESGYAEIVQEEFEPQDCYYIPKQIVIREESSSTKVRLCFDGSASEEGKKSINKQLETGPTLQPLLNSILLRFRLHPIAMTSDIKKMYLMIGVAEEDRDKLRFFWLNPETGEVEIYRNCVLPFGLTCSPFLAVGTVQHHLRKYQAEYPALITELIESTYMDDLLSGVETEAEAIQMYRNSSKIMKEAGMELRKWTTNNKRIQKMFEKDGVAAEASKRISEDVNNTYKLLGIQYDAESDSFTFNVDGILNKEKKKINVTTKRNILSTAPRLYDPMGWLNPVIVKVKILMQTLWERGFEWDESVPPDIDKKWKQWIEDLQYLNELKISRRYNHSTNLVDPDRSELHVFGDASELAYAAVAYLKTYDAEGTSEVTMMYCKSKVAPIKKVTLPRLELQAAVLGVKVAEFIKNEAKIPIVRTYMWTDSQITLHWVRSTSREYKTYVANRVEQIHELSEPADWRWCPGASNPADLPSRGVTMRELVTSTPWWGGPTWLKGSAEGYPTVKNLQPPAEELLERKQVVCLLQKSNKKEIPMPVRLAGKLIDPMKYSKFKTLIKTTAYITRYLFNLTHQEEERNYETLSADDIVQAENYWLQRIQEESFPAETIKLQRNEPVNANSKLVKLTPYYDETDGLIKMRGRVQYANLNEIEKHPIILPYNSYLVKLIVEDVHRKQLHSGINHTLIAVRDKYWVIKGRSLVRRVVKACLVCRRYAPIRLQVQMPPLPKDRITRSYPFSVCGVDFTGPVYVKNGNQVTKSYIVLYTCTAIRAIHLELVENQTTEAFLRSFRRMISRRGMVTTFYSDNSKTFEAGSREMQRYFQIMKGKTFKNFLADHKIEWKFIPPYAPWWGGFYERMMKTIKTPLKKILGRSIYSSDEIYTILTEVEAMVNSRPLTQVSDEPTELEYLTPASFLIGRKLINLPVKPIQFKDKSKEKKEVNKILVMQNRTLNMLWKTWREEYVRNLGTVPRKINEDTCIKAGELVMVAEPSVIRTKWIVGVVDKCKAGPDNKVRTVWVRTAGGIMSRPVQHISRLELDSFEDFKLHTI